MCNSILYDDLMFQKGRCIVEKSSVLIVPWLGPSETVHQLSIVYNVNMYVATDSVWMIINLQKR